MTCLTSELLPVQAVAVAEESRAQLALVDQQERPAPVEWVAAPAFAAHVMEKADRLVSQVQRDATARRVSGEAGENPVHSPYR